MRQRARLGALLPRASCLLLLLALAGCAGAANQSIAAVATAESPWRTAVVPGAAWERVPSPELAGYRKAGLDHAVALLKTMPTTGFVVVAYGRILLEYGDVTALSYLASSRKSVLSMLFGNYVAQGKVRLDQTLAQLHIDDRGDLTPAEKRATIRDLLRTSSGVYHPASNPGDNLADAPPRGSQKPGTFFLYSNWDFNVLGTIFEQETGRDIYEALESDLARPIGMQDFDRAAQQKSGDTTRSRHLAYHMSLSTRDMARLGMLMLRGGRWNDRQVIPAGWVRESTTPFVKSWQMNPPPARNGRLGYGYLRWILEEPASSPLAGGFSSRGAYGQYILVVPKLDLVIAHKRAIQDGQENQPVTWEQFLEVARRVVDARCRKAC